MTYPIDTDIIRRVQDPSGNCLEVAPYPDAPSSPCIRAANKRSAEYWCLSEDGIAMEPEMARHLGRALIACADECDERRKNVEG